MSHGNKWYIVSVSYHHRHACDVSEHYKQKLETANKLFWQLQSCQKSLEARERELNKYETKAA